MINDAHLRASRGEPFIHLGVHLAVYQQALHVVARLFEWRPRLLAGVKRAPKRRVFGIIKVACLLIGNRNGWAEAEIDEQQHARLFSNVFPQLGFGESGLGDGGLKGCVIQVAAADGCQSVDGGVGRAIGKASDLDFAAQQNALHQTVCGGAPGSGLEARFLRIKKRGQADLFLNTAFRNGAVTHGNGNTVNERGPGGGISRKKHADDGNPQNACPNEIWNWNQLNR